MKVTKNKRGSKNWGPAEIRELMSFIPEQSARGVPWEERAHLWKARFGTTRSGASLRAQFTRIKNGWYPKNVMCRLSEGVTSGFIEITNPTENRRHSISFTPETASEAYQSGRNTRVPLLPSILSEYNPIMHQCAIVSRQPAAGFMPQVLHRYGNRDSEEANYFPFTH
ncbi:hypothetical protein KXW21_002480 [Aspergillus fumigatus]|nr:hypothetical protein KXW21_002480 [Aspergillus fumigatus]